MRINTGLILVILDHSPNSNFSVPDILMQLQIYICMHIYTHTPVHLDKYTSKTIYIKNNISNCAYLCIYMFNSKRDKINQ